MQQKLFAVLGTLLALALLVPAGYTLFTLTQKSTPPSSTLSAITSLNAGAFGDLGRASALPQSDSKGGGEKMSAPSYEDGLSIFPGAYEETIYVYTFTEDLTPYLTESQGTVYERQASSAFDGSLLKELSSSFSALNLDTFLKGKLTSFVLRSGEYLLSIDTPSNTWNLYKDWSSYDSSETWSPLEVSDLPSDEELFAVATQFATDWGIDLSTYGAPVIGEQEIALARMGVSDVYVPESATVVFPTRIDTHVAYPSWAHAPVGLRMTIQIRDMSVSGAYDSLSQQYNASSYKLIQDTGTLTKLIAGGGNIATPYPGIAYNEVLVPLNAPERILTEYSLYENGTSRTLFVPALRFTLSDPTQIPWSSGAITIPLVEEIVNAQ